MAAATLSAVIPTLNAAATLPDTLRALAGRVDEIVVADAGSRDGTAALAEAAGARVMTGVRGRGAQVAAAAAASRGEWLLLLHADTVPAPGWREAAAAHMAARPEQAGYFRFRLASDDPRARRLERMVAWRCRVMALPYGDQGLLIARSLLAEVGGIRPLPLLEDADLVRRLGRRRLAPLPVDAVTSPAKWERDGWTRRSLRNVACLALWYAGVPPRVIARLY